MLQLRKKKRDDGGTESGWTSSGRTQSGKAL